MAPIAPKKRSSIREKTSKTSTSIIARPTKVHREGAVIDDGFNHSKSDKRLIKHSAFINRIEKAYQKPVKRRRPSKKLITTLESIADALPNTEDCERILCDEKIRHKTMKVKPGAMKKRGKLEKMERDRFRKNLAQLIGGSFEATGIEAEIEATTNRWAALRGFISQTLEHKPEFAEKKI